MISALLRHRIWRLSPQRLCRMLEELGPVYVKLGQIASAGSGVLPPEYCNALAALRTDAAPMPFEQVRLIIERELGQPPEEFFTHFGEDALGSASVAQVHYARLDSQAVAVKVQRPGLLEQVEKDIRLMRRLSGLLRLTPANQVIGPDMVLDELQCAARQELDFTAEADNLEAFLRANGEGSCPRVYRELTTRNVLVMEYIDGIRLDHTGQLAAAGCDTVRLLDAAVKDYARQLLESRFFHADPHPGNAIVRDGRIVWIDLGLVGGISERDSRYLKQGIKAVIEFNPEKVADVLIGMGSGDPPVNKGALTAAVAEGMGIFRNTPLSSLDLPRFLSMFLSAASENGITMPKGVSQLTRGVLVMKGTIDALSPDADLVYLLGRILPELDFEHIEEERASGGPSV